MNTLKKISIHVVVLTILIAPIVLYAQNVPPSTQPTQFDVKINNPFSGGDDLMSLITAILNKVVMPVAAVAVVIWIIWAGFTYLLANGKPAEIQKAHQRLMWSLIGAGILLGAAGISTVVQNTITAITKTS